MGSDGMVAAQQAWDLVHGNPLLRGWTMSDVSFYAVELPEAALAELLGGGVSAGAVRVVEAVNLTAVVLLAGALARGGATGRAGMLRAVIAAATIGMPVPGANRTTLLANPDHVGTQIPVLLAFLLVDRVRPRWWVPVAVAALLTWGRISDPMVLLEGEVPLLAVCAARCYRRRQAGYEFALAGAAMAAELLADLFSRAIRTLGGFSVVPLQNTFTQVDQLSSHLWSTVESFLILYGADFSGQRLAATPGLLTPITHLVGAALAATAAWYAARRFTSLDLTMQVVAVSLGVSLLAYTLLDGTAPGSLAHDLMPAAPAGAVLAGRLLSDDLARRGLLPVLACALTWSLGFLALEVSRPVPANSAAPLTGWLTGHGLRYGLSGYFVASDLTVAGGSGVTVVPVNRSGDRLVLSPWESDASWYDMARHDATFLVVPTSNGCPADAQGWWTTGAIRVFGRPARRYTVDGMQILVWSHNLLRDPLPQRVPGHPAPC